jgi:hypothetical protein
MPNKIHYTHILVKTENEARTAIELPNRGEQIANIAKQVLPLSQTQRTSA